MKATKNNVIEERFAVVIVRECLIAFAFLHRSSVIHRDVKGEPSKSRVVPPLLNSGVYSCKPSRHGHGQGDSM